MSITSLKDIDREILKYIDDEELLRICSLNRRMWYETCDDNFLRRRLNKYLNIEKCKTENENWKRFFLRSINYIKKMKEGYNFKYSEGDFMKQYDILKDVRNENDLLNGSSKYGELSLVKFAVANGVRIHPFGDVAVGWAAENGHLDVVKYLVEDQKADLHKDYEFALRWSAGAGYLEVVKYLIKHGADLHVREDGALRQACENGKVHVVKYLVGSGANIHALEDRALIMASMYGYIDIVKYLVEQGANINDKALRLAIENNHTEVVQYLKDL